MHNSSDLFENLKIAQNEDYKTHLNKYNVIALIMFDERSMIQPGKFAQYIGFTEMEVAELCERYRTSFESMKEWYDGYRFRQFNPGATIVPPEQMNSHNSSLIHIYNPKSVVDSIRNQSFASYWTLTETYEALRIYIDMNFQDLKNSIISMIAGDSVKIDTGAFQNDMQTFSSKDDVLTLLIHLGYLSYDFASHTVRIPNTEIRSEFIRAIKRSVYYRKI